MGQLLDLLAITEEIYFHLLSAIPGPSQGWAGAAGSRCLAVGAAVIAAGLGARLGAGGPQEALLGEDLAQPEVLGALVGQGPGEVCGAEHT